jgi:hypothetical protein
VASPPLAYKTCERIDPVKDLASINIRQSCFRTEQSVPPITGGIVLRR